MATQPEREPTKPIDFSQRAPMFPDQQNPNQQIGMPQQAPPGYYQLPPPPVKKNNAQVLPVMMAMFAIVCSVVISFLMMGKLTAPIGLVTTVDVQEGLITKLNEDLTTPGTGFIPRLEALINSSAKYVQQSDLNGLAPIGIVNAKADITSVNALADQIATLQTTITDQGLLIAQLKADLVEIQEGTVTPPPGTSANITVGAQLQFGSYFVIPKATTTEIQIPVRVTVTNNSNSDMKDVRVYVGFVSQSPLYVAVDWATGSPTLTSLLTQWQSVSGNPLYFQNGWGLNVNANSTVTLQAMLSIQLNTGLVSDMTLAPVAGIA